ncbi:atrophin-1 isoform X2 [Cephus cinctus]|uniref:Atrophin-1 isoform X2 n=1 Tax=Cephus cinctus TaxID=211228 RepID=A0AAJ7FUF2_CEPCN|nr:atrophin-1 isoform X2 [Cephus cinctus]
MVCKENVVSWFGNLSSYKRIDIMCTLLNMCLPFEVRYLGTCVEDLGKRDYNDLRDTEHRANNVSDLAELTNLGVTDKRTRRKLALYMALLHSCNYSCAVILYKNLSNVDFQEIVNLLNGTTFTQDDQPLEELLLLYTMALNHPAFTYEQKSVFGNIYVRLQEEEARLNPPKPIVNSSYKNAQGCTPCVTPNDRTIDSEIPANCLMPPPQMPNYHGEMPMRTNTMVSGVPPGLTMQPPPGLCLPSPEQLPVGSGTAPYFTLGFPSVNHMPPWAGQVMMGNQAMYHIGDVLAHPPSPLVSRQSSPSQSRSPSRSNSPMGRRNNTMPRTTSQITQSDSNTLTTSTSSSGSQTSMTSSSNNTSLQQLPSLASGRNHSNQQAPLLPSRTVPPPAIGSSTSSSHVTHSRDNSIDNAASPPANASNLKQQQPPPPPRLRSSTSADSLRETLGKEMPNFKGNLQNYSLEEIRRMSDEELRDLGLTSNAVGQLRSIVKSQTVNGLNQLAPDKKLESTNNATHPVVDHVENEEQQPFVHHHHNHNTNVRRYPTIPPMEPSQMQMYPAPPPVYAAHNTPCYACLTMSVPGVQNRYPRCNAPHVYCVTQLQALRLDAEGSRHCSQSSSSESTGSRSPPETPPAMPWVGGGAGDSSVPPPTDHLGAGTPLHSTVTSVSHPPPSVPQQMQQQQQQQQQQPHPERQRTSRRNPAHVVRQKNQMVNGGGPPSLAHCVSFSAPPNHTPVTYLPHGHFQALRPSTGLYSNFSHAAAAATAAYARPGYPTSYQPNGEIMFQYPTGQPGSGGTPPPPPTAAAPAQTYLPPAPVVTYSPAVQSAKISCYNCGSSSHHASDCKDQTMEDLTKRAQYRLDYTIMKQPGECPSSDK